MRRWRTSRAQPEIWEVILTGGDPFLLSARRVREITERLAAIDHVKIIRWHTRVPAVDPLRVTPDLVEALRVEGATTYVVLHTNHARELTRASARGDRADRRCRRADAVADGAADAASTTTSRRWKR